MINYGIERRMKVVTFFTFSNALIAGLTITNSESYGQTFLRRKGQEVTPLNATQAVTLPVGGIFSNGSPLQKNGLEATTASTVAPVYAVEETNTVIPLNSYRP